MIANQAIGKPFCIALSLVGSIAVHQPGFGWTSDATVNTSICVSSGSQTEVFSTSDGAGGAILAWSDTRNGDSDVYAQRIDTNGQPLWATDGVPVCSGTDSQTAKNIFPDGSGGALVVYWLYVPNPNGPPSRTIRVQRIDSTGAVQWTPDGAYAGNISYLSMSAEVSDGAGGVITVWTAPSPPTFSVLRVYGQRVRPDGTLAWGTNGVQLSGGSGNQYLAQVVSDGAGGGIFVWFDQRAGGAGDIYAQ